MKLTKMAKEMRAFGGFIALFAVVALILKYVVDAMFGFDLWDYEKWTLLWIIVSLYVGTIVMLGFFRKISPKQKYFDNIQRWGYWVVVIMLPFFFLSILEIGLFKFTQTNPYWRMLDRNFAAYGDVSDIARFMDDASPYRSQRPVAYGLTLYKKASSPVYNVNGHGFRTREFMPRERSEWRIGFLGGSTTWGSWVRDHETIPHFVGARLQERSSKNIVVYNLGVEGANIKSEIRIAQSLFKVIEFNQLVFYDGVNDIPTILTGNDQRMPPSIKIMEEQGASDENRGSYVRLASIWERLLLKIRDFEIVQSIKFLVVEMAILASAGNKRTQQTVAADLDVQRSATYYLDSYREMNRFCEEQELKCDFFLQPFIAHKEEMSNPEKRILNVLKKKIPRYVDHYNRTVDAIMGERNHNIHDLRGAIKRGPMEVFTDAVHVNSRGNSQIADALTGVLLHQ